MKEPKMSKLSKNVQKCRISKMEIFTKIVNGCQLLTIFAKGSILDARLGDEYAFVICSSKYFDKTTISCKHFLIVPVVPQRVLCILMVCF